jgi:hypothetical protein
MSIEWHRELLERFKKADEEKKKEEGQKKKESFLAKKFSFGQMPCSLASSSTGW